MALLLEGWREGRSCQGRHQNSLPLTTNLSQKLTQPSKGISSPVGDLCRHFTIQTFPPAYTLHSNQIPQTDGTNGFLGLVAYISQTGHHCFPSCFCHPTVWNFDVSPQQDATLETFKENINILYIKLKKIKFPIQILLPSECSFILFQTK